MKCYKKDFSCFQYEDEGGDSGDNEGEGSGSRAQQHRVALNCLCMPITIRLYPHLCLCLCTFASSHHILAFSPHALALAPLHPCSHLHNLTLTSLHPHTFRSGPGPGFAQTLMPTIAIAMKMKMKENGRWDLKPQCLPGLKRHWNLAA